MTEIAWADVIEGADDGSLELAEHYAFNDHKGHVALAPYVALGFRFVFWPRESDPTNDWKGPRDKTWPTKTYDPADYRDGMQVGVKLGTEIAPGRFLWDADFDWPPGIEFAREFLPATGFGFGRPSKPTGHAFYTASAPVTFYKFKDIDGTNLGERRGTKTDGTIGYQTMLPPSVHRDSGETLTLTMAEHITHDDSAVEGYTHYMVACLLGRHWPKNGPETNQHDTAGYVAGFLCQRRVDPKRVPAIVEVAATLGGDDNVRDRVTYARNTVAKFKDGERKLTGGPKLAQEMGPDVVARLREWLPSASDDTLEFPQTEAGDAECFASLYHGSVRYDHRQGRWLVSDEMSGIWVPDPVERLTQLAIETSRARQQQANLIEDVDKKKAAWKWAVKGEGRGHINNVLALARSVPPIADIGDNWDLEPFLLGAQNGVVDLRTGQWRKAEAADRVTMRVRTSYDSTATCGLWRQFLADIFAPSDLFNAEESERLVSFIQRAIGYSVTGSCKEECCFFAWGEGGNGKGTLMNTIGWLLGDYTDDMPYSTLERSAHGGGIPNDVAKMAGKRFITCAEVNEFTINESRLKALTGRDPMTARFLNHEFFTFIPVGKIWIATNNKPKIVGTDDGIWRRIYLIPFTQQFTGRENKELKDQLRLELPGILNWVIDGARRWQECGLDAPQTVKAATAAYRDEANPLTPFIEACCVVHENARVQAANAFKAYETFCHDSGIEPWRQLSNKRFFKAMEQRFERNEERKQTFYVGVGLRQREPVAGSNEGV